MTATEDRLAYLEERVDELVRFQIVANHRIGELERRESLLVQHMTLQFKTLTEYIEKHCVNKDSLFS